MSETTTLGRVLMSDALPPGYKDITEPLNKKSLTAILEAYAKSNPDEWPKVMRDVEKVALLSASSYGRRTSPGLDDLEPPPAVAKMQMELRMKIKAIAQSRTIPQNEKGALIVKTMLPEMVKVQDILKNVGFDKNTFIDHELTGSMSKMTAAMQLLFGDMVVVDHKERPVPIPGLHGYGEGVTPSEFWAGAYGARKGLVDLQLATPDAGFLCLHGDTLVRMADFSVKRIRDVVEGDFVMGANKEGEASPARVLAKFNNGVRPVEEFIFRRGAGRNDFISIKATGEHKVLAAFKRGKRKSKPLEPRQLKDARDGFSLKPAFGFKSGAGKPFGLAFFIGALIGDGCTSGHNATFSCADETLIDFLVPYLDKHGLTLTRIIRPGYKAPDIEFYVGCGGPSGYISDGRSIKTIPGAFTSLLKELGLSGKRSWEKGIPEAVDGWDRESISELIGGIWSTDGCATYSNLSKLPLLRLGMTSEKVVSRMKELLETRFGIYSNKIMKSCQSVGKTRNMLKYDLTVKSTKPVYILNISNACSVRRFFDEIPMRGRKMTSLRALMAGFEGSERDMSYSFTYQNSSFIGMEETFDIEVDCPDHLFVLDNGAIVSNSKQMTQAAHRVVVTAEDCGAEGVGLEVDGSSPDNVGALLASPAGGLKAGHLLTSRDVASLEGKRVVVRSAITCHMPDGVCSKCAGVRESGNLAAIGDHIGITAARAIAEPLTQAVISSKHTGGVAGIDDKKTTGFKAVDMLMQVPRNSPDWAPLAESDGIISAIEKAGQGGWYVMLGGSQTYVPSKSTLKVKAGDHVEQGDALASGIPNPARVAELKGLGAARQYYTELLGDTIKANGAGNHRRNVEAMSRAFLSRVEITDLDGVEGYFPGDVVPHAALTAGWEPRKGAETLPAGRAVGMYLEAPYLHYLVGDRISQSAAAKLAASGVAMVLAHKDPPQFRPVVSSVRDIGTDDPDWETRLGGFNLKTSLLDAAARGSTSDPGGTSYIPKIVSGRLN